MFVHHRNVKELENVQQYIYTDEMGVFVAVRFGGERMALRTERVKMLKMSSF